MMKRILGMISVMIELVCVWITCKMIYNNGIIRDKYNIGIRADEIADNVMCSGWMILILLIIILMITIIQLVSTWKK